MTTDQEKMKTITDGNLQEMRQHGTKDFPLGVYLDDFAQVDQARIPWHWHEEIQFDLVVEGSIQFQIGSKAYVLQEGQCMFINTGVLHQIFPVEGMKGKLYAFVLRDSLLETDALSAVFRKCLLPLLKGQVDCIAFMEEGAIDKRAADLLRRIWDSFLEKEAGYQIEIKGLLCCLWSCLLKKNQQKVNPITSRERRDMDRVKTAITFMQEHYQEPLSLEDIAGQLALSKSELCRCFQRVMHTTPYDYLIQCRVRAASERLKRSDERILDIALQCGFDSLGHMGRYFRKYLGCSPSAFRKS